MHLKNIKGEAVLAEFIGTFGLTFAVLAAMTGPILGLTTGVVAAITVALFVLLIGSVSGCHINPAVTIGQFSIGKITTSSAISYVIAQLSGALLALVIFALFRNGEIFNLGAHIWWNAFWAEVIGTAVLGFAVASTLYNKLDTLASALSIGGGIFLGVVFASVGSVGLLNPAVAAGVGSASWPYVVGPLVGAIIGMNLYRVLLPAKTKR